MRVLSRVIMGLIKMQLNKLQFIVNIVQVNNFMFSSTTPLQIKNNPSNTSTAKNHWSFGKSPRFKDPRTNCNRSSYQEKSSLSSRRAGIGFGSRSKYFDGSKQIMDPGLYNSCSNFDYKRPENSRKGYSFTNNRDQLNFSNYLKVQEKTPAPNKYQGDSNQVKRTRAYSLRPKTAYPKNYFLFSDPEAQRIKMDPGPGKYQTISNFGSKQFTSNNKNLAQTSFIGKDRFNKEKTTPGPGDYIINEMQPDGQYKLSNMRGSGRRAILNEKRVLKLDGNKFTPGPGTYRQPSDFGHYEGQIRPKTARK